MPYRFIGRGLEPHDLLSLGCVLASVSISVGIAALTMPLAAWWAWACATVLFGGLTIYGFSGD